MPFLLAITLKEVQQGLVTKFLGQPEGIDSGSIRRLRRRAIGKEDFGRLEVAFADGQV